MADSLDLQSRVEERLSNLSPAQRELVLRRLRAQAPSGLTRVPRGGELPLSFAQQRLYFLDQLSDGGAGYNISGGVRIRGSLSPAVLERALLEIIARHEILRTRYPQGRVVIEPPPAGPVLVNRRAAPEEVAALAGQELRRPLSLAEGPLFRFVLLELAPDEHVFLVTLHHIVADGWSLGLLIREAGQLYDAFLRGDASPLAPLPVQYVDFADWQKNRLQGAVLEQQLAFWKEHLAGAPQFLNLPTDYPRGATQDFAGANYSAVLPAQLVDRLTALGAAHGATLFMTTFAAFAVLLGRYSGQEDLLLGSPVANRTRTEAESLLGLFVNTLVLRANLTGNPSFTDLLERVQSSVRRAFSHQETPFDLLVDALQPTRSLSHSPLFQVMFALQNAHVASGGEAWARTPGGELSLQTLPPEEGTAKFDLTLFLEKGQHGFTATWEYATSLFDPPAIVRMHSHFLCLLESIVEQPETSVALLPMVATAELRQLLQEWNATAADYPRDKTFPRLFEQQAERTPAAVAVRSDAASLTYAELNARSNQLASYLRGRGIGAEDVVGLYCSRSVELMIGVLGTLKAGAAYVPLDIGYPPARILLMLEDAQAALVLTQTLFAGSLPEYLPRLCLDSAASALAGQSPENSETSPGPDQLAYVLYTSGSTGVPKGVEVPHGGLTNYLWWALSAYDVAGGSGAPMLSSISFDATITAWFLPLLAGCTVQMVAEGDEVESLRGLLRTDANYSLLKITPAHLEAVIHLAEPRDFSLAARAFVIGGEALLTRQITFWRQHAPGLKLINEYGPTETVVGCCVYDVPQGFGDSGAVPIGRPIANTLLYVLDPHGQPAPIGVPGELYIGGAGVARGYRRRPELTEQRFLRNPFAPGRLYRTGDRVKYLTDGTLLFLGRLDDQVKIRGFRVELGEVEAVFARHSAVQECAVVAESQRLLASLVPSGEDRPLSRDMRAFAAGILPEYMVPSLFTWLDAMPLTPNGKLDRRALPVLSAPETMERVAPRTEAEQSMAQLWIEVLGVAAVGVDDNFFELGGHSLLAIQLISRVRHAFGVELPLRRLFESPTVAELTALLPRADATSAPAIQRVSRDQYRKSRQ